MNRQCVQFAPFIPATVTHAFSIKLLRVLGADSQKVRGALEENMVSEGYGSDREGSALCWQNTQNL